MTLLLKRCIKVQPYFSRLAHTLDYSKLPLILEKDIEEMHVRGSGPGGQKINKTASCVVLKHIPTGIVVKCQETRFLEKNRQIARNLLNSKVDNFINQENSVEAKLKARDEKKSSLREQKQKKMNMLKELWKNREFGSENL